MTGHLLKLNVEEEFSDYLRDESRRTGRADTLSFATSEEDVRHVLSRARHGLSVTVQGARTGVTGGAVPDGGHVLNLSRMTRVTGLAFDPDRREFRIRVEPGLPLVELRRQLESAEFDTTGWTRDSLAALEEYRRAGRQWFPPDPTETSASIGGMVACNASGACSFRYGATRNHVTAMRVILADGSPLFLRRGRERALGREFSLCAGPNREIRGWVPAYRLPWVKNAAGYFTDDDMDLIDLFIGSEGTLGIFTEIELRLSPEPACRWGVMAFFPSEVMAVEFVKGVRGLPGEACPAAIEFFDSHALDLLRTQKAGNPAFAEIPDLPAAYHTAIYVEHHGDQAAVERMVEEMPARMAALGASDDAAWVADSARDLERFRFFRHAVPEAVNLTIDERRKRVPTLSKLGTDMAVPNSQLDAVLALYRAGLAAAGLEYVVFGHIGNNHLHVNILPRSLHEYDVGKALYLEWAREVVAMGGTVSAEHGIGKFKVALLREMFGNDGIKQMRELKRLFDPDGILNRGNLF